MSNNKMPIAPENEVREGFVVRTMSWCREHWKLQLLGGGASLAVALLLWTIMARRSSAAVQLK
jgi:hypothetical protein